MDDLYPGWDGLRAGTHRAQEWVVGPLTGGPAGPLPPVGLGGRRVRRVGAAAVVGGRRARGLRLRALPAGKAASVLVWVEAEESVRRARGLARDPGYGPFWERWAVQERRLYDADRTWERADLFLDTTTDRR